MKTRPQTLAKAARLVVAARKDGSYDVAGDHGTYRSTDSTCTCLAGRTGSRCSHQLAVRYQRERQHQGPSA